MEHKLIEKYFEKNELRIQLIINDYYSYINTIIKNNTNVNEEDAEEIISDVIFIVWKNTEKLDRKRRLTPYIAGITKKVIYKRYKVNIRKLQTIEEFEEKDCISDFNVEKLIEEKELNEYILKKLEGIEIDIFRMYYFEDKSINRISKETKLTKSNVKTKLCRIRKKLKEQLRNGGF